MQEKRVVHEEREMKREGGQERNRQTGAKWPQGLGKLCCMCTHRDHNDPETMDGSKQFTITYSKSVLFCLFIVEHITHL